MKHGAKSEVGGSISYAVAVIVSALVSYLLCPTSDALTLRVRVLIGFACTLAVGNVVSNLRVVKSPGGAFTVSSLVGVAGAVMSELGHWIWL